jgi:cation-transporting ATPase E
MLTGQAQQERPPVTIPSATRGLSEVEVIARRKRGMGNIFPLKSSRSYWQIMRENLFISVNVILFALGLALIVLGQVSDALIFVPRQNAILTLLTEGIPALALVWWARSGPFQQRRPLRALLHFVLPAALTLSLLGLGVYLTTFLTAQLSMAQSALTTFTIVCGLLLIPFVEPPSKFWVGGSGPGGDWCPSLLALGLLLGYAGLLAIAPLRAFFELTVLDGTIYLSIGAVALAWALLVRWLWRFHLLERFLQVDWREE